MKTIITTLAIGAFALAFTAVPAKADENPNNPVTALLQIAGDTISLVPDTAVEIITFGTADTHTYNKKRNVYVAQPQQTVVYERSATPVHVVETAEAPLVERHVIYREQ